MSKINKERLQEIIREEVNNFIEEQRVNEAKKVSLKIGDLVYINHSSSTTKPTWSNKIHKIIKKQGDEFITTYSKYPYPAWSLKKANVNEAIAGQPSPVIQKALNTLTQAAIFMAKNKKYDGSKVKEFRSAITNVTKSLHAATSSVN